MLEKYKAAGKVILLKLNLRRVKIKMVCYTNNQILAALRRKYYAIFPSEIYHVNIWMSKNEHFHLNILKLKQGELGKDEKLEQIREAANDVYEELSDNDSFFNEVYNPNVREIRRDFSSAAFIVLCNDIF